MKSKQFFLLLSLLTLFIFNCKDSQYPKVEISEEPVIENDELEITIPQVKQITDSTVYHYDTSKQMGGSWTTYRNGIVIEKGQTEEVNACFIYSGIQYYYDSTGSLKQTRDYVVRKELSRSCHETGFNILEKNYYQDGVLESEKTFQSCVECEEFKAGIWKFYDNQGKLIKTKGYGWREMKF